MHVGQEGSWLFRAEQFGRLLTKREWANNAGLMKAMLGGRGGRGSHLRLIYR